MYNEIIERTIKEFHNEAKIDFFDVSLVAGSLREDLKLKTQNEIIQYTLEVIRRLIQLGIYPGDYDHAAKISFWPGSLNELLERIEAEWIAMGQTPTLEHPICWFGLKRPEPA